MITKNTTCTECGLSMEYWTKSSAIKCTKCEAILAVEPCEDDAVEVEDVEIDG